MSGEFVHYLNGTEIDEPHGWGDFTEEFDRDHKSRIISIKYESKLTFVHGGYAMLNNLYNTEGYCGIVSYEAKQWCGNDLLTCCKGSIILADCVFNETRCSVECDIADEGVGARIVNNQEIPISPTADKTKNGDDLDTITPVDLVIFRPSDGFFPLGANRRAWDWYDAIRHAVLYITDGEVYATSTWYEALPDEERYCFLDGNELRVAAGDNPRLTYDFKTLFNELAIKYDLWIFATVDVSGNPVLRIEPQSTFFGTTSSTYVQPDIQDLLRGIDTDQVYAKVKVGSDTFKKAIQTGGLSLPFLVLRGQTREEFSFQGVCNSSATLDLVNEWIIDTNAIEDVVVNNNEDFDDDMFLIQYDQDTGDATQGFYLNPANFPALYNEQLQNYLVLDRYDMPSDVGTFYSSVDASFMAHRITATNTPITETGTPAGDTTPGIVQYDNDYTAPNFDTTNTWGNGTVQGNPVSQANSRYTAPVQGFYVLDTTVNWRIIQNIPFMLAGLRNYKHVRIVLSFDHYNAANTLIQSVVIAGAAQYVPGSYQQYHVAGLSMDVGDYVQVVAYFNHSTPTYTGNDIVGPDPNPPFFVSGVTFSLIENSVIATNFVTGGGFLAGGDVSRILRYEYERHITLGDWLNLTATPEDIIPIGGGPTANIPVHVKNAKRTTKTGETTWQMIKRP